MGKSLYVNIKDFVLFELMGGCISCSDCAISELLDMLDICNKVPTPVT